EKGFMLARTDRVSYNGSKKKSKLPVVFLCRPSDQVQSQELFVDIFFVHADHSDSVEFHGRAQLTYRKGATKFLAPRSASVPALLASFLLSPPLLPLPLFPREPASFPSQSQSQTHSFLKPLASTSLTPSLESMEVSHQQQHQQQLQFVLSSDRAGPGVS